MTVVEMENVKKIILVYVVETIWETHVVKYVKITNLHINVIYGNNIVHKHHIELK
jgi:hypothetical protein